MNKINTIFRHLRAMGLIIICIALPISVSAKEKDCWVDLYDDTQYKGHHVLLKGPVELSNLNQVNGENWAMRISSLKVGPDATLTVFDDINFRLSSTDMAKSPELMKAWGITEKDIKEEFELVFHPNSAIHDLSDFHFHNKVKSLKIGCR